MKLTTNERFNLLMQAKILEKLTPEISIEDGQEDGLEKESLKKFITALERGYEIDYSRYPFEFSEDELSKEYSEFVHRVLDMYYDMRLSFNALEDKGVTEEMMVEFPGFDANTNMKMLMYARDYLYSLEEGQQMKEIWHGQTAVRNSHWDNLEMLHKQLVKYEELVSHESRNGTMSAEQIKTIFEARNPERTEEITTPIQ